MLPKAMPRSEPRRPVALIWLVLFRLALNMACFFEIRVLLQPFLCNHSAFAYFICFAHDVPNLLTESRIFLSELAHINGSVNFWTSSSNPYNSFSASSNVA